MAAAAPSSEQLAEELIALTRALATPGPAPASALQQHLQRMRSLPADQLQSVCGARDSSGRSALHHLCAAGAAGALRELLAMGAGAAGIIGAQDGQGQTALHLALQTATDARKAGSDAQGALQCAHLLLEQEELARHAAGASSAASSSAAAASSASTSASASSSDGPAAKRARVSDPSMDDTTSVPPPPTATAAAAAAATGVPSQPSLLSLPDSFARLPLHWAVAATSRCCCAVWPGAAGRRWSTLRRAAGTRLCTGPVRTTVWPAWTCS